MATAQLSARQVAALEADGYRIVRPTGWPPPELQMDDPVLSVGFPSPWRLHVAWDQIDFRSTTKLALIHQLRPHEFACQIDPAFGEEYRTVSEEIPPANELPGMSGGPGFLVRQKRVLVPALCGIITHRLELEDGNKLLYFARLEGIRPDGRIRG